jgi:hypothetical protein
MYPGPGVQADPVELHRFVMRHAMHFTKFEIESER